MKIKNSPSSDAVKSFILPWNTLDDNFNIRSETFYKNKSGYTTKFILETSTGHDGDSIYGYSVFMYIVIFVKEFNAYYKAEYIRHCVDLDDSTTDYKELEFNLMESGSHDIKIIKWKTEMSKVF